MNDTVMHVANSHLPFGGTCSPCVMLLFVALLHFLCANVVAVLAVTGVGPSGLGAYHGKVGFDTLSHTKSVLSVPTWSDPALRYA